MIEIRIDKFLSSQLNISRNDAKKLIKTALVTVKGIQVKKSDFLFNPDVDDVCVNHEKIEYKKNVYIMLNKPQGVVSAVEDNVQTTVVDILPDSLKRKGLFPAGRLDKDTVGFVLLTDDGEFAHNILSPAHHVPKTYLVEVENALSSAQLEKFTSGMKIGEENFKPAKISLTDEKSENENYIYKITITEGRYHQIKRMFAAVSNPVINLKRIAIGSLPLDESLLPGQARELTKEELSSISRIIV